jgi:hypothetical protein
MKKYLTSIKNNQFEFLFKIKEYTRTLNKTFYSKGAQPVACRQVQPKETIHVAPLTCL